MGLHPYDKPEGANTIILPTTTASRIDADNQTLSTKLDMLINSTVIEMGAACCKGSYRKAGKSMSMRHKNRRNSIKRCQKVRGFSQFDNSLLDDFYNSQTKCILSQISNWSFDVFALEKASNGRALFHIILKLFQHHNLIDHFELDVVKLMTFATFVEEGYQNNPYHNATHAADVAQAMHCYITQAKIAKHMTPLEILISIVSAITHDLDHPGVNQGFLMATNNHLANLYDNKAVLEKHHWRAGLAVLHQSGLFNNLSDSERAKIENEMESLILATDMTRQQDFLSKLKARVQEGSLDMSVYADRHFILQIALKCADISNPCRSWSSCKVWSDKVCEEFFRQGDYERDLDLKISPLCDRYSNTIPKIQTGFIDFCVVPLFTEFEKYLFPSSTLSEQLTNLTLNRQRWQDKIDAAVRPSTLSISLTIDTAVCEVPSPTASENGDIPSPTISLPPTPTKHQSLTLDSNTNIDALDRRHSEPSMMPTENKGLKRQQSFQERLSDGRGENSDLPKDLLDKLTGHTSQLKINIVNNNGDNAFSKILENLKPEVIEQLRTWPHLHTPAYLITSS